MAFDASWEPDLWGKVRNTIREQQYNAQLSAADLENERLTEQASLAIFFFELRGQDALIEIFQNTIAADQKSLDLHPRPIRDWSRRSDLRRRGAEYATERRSPRPSTSASPVPSSSMRSRCSSARQPSGFSIPVKPLLTTAPSIPIGVPSQLLERRPDIAAAERNMASANAQIGIANAAFYPNLTLSAQGGLESSTFKHLLDWPSRFWSIGPSVSETIFDAGLRRATVNQFIAVYNADVASYRQTVLTAFQQVEDNLAAVRILSTQMQQQQAAQQSAQQFVGLAMARYQTGIDPYINVVIAQIDPACRPAGADHAPDSTDDSLRAVDRSSWRRMG